MSSLHDAIYAFTAALPPARKAWQSAAGTALASSGLSVSVATPVLLVSRMGEGVFQHVLAERIGVHPAALVRTLDQAEKADLLERRMVPGNRRIRAIHLLPAGRRVAKKLEKAVKSLRDNLLQDLPEADIATATRVLRIFEERARQHAEQVRANSA